MEPNIFRLPDGFFKKLLLQLARNMMMYMFTAATVLCLLAITAFCTLISSKNCTATEQTSTIQTDNGTIFFLNAGKDSQTLTDTTGRFTPIVTGGKRFNDPILGTCLRFGDGNNNSIVVADEGNIRFEGGFTLETWLYLEESGQPNQGGVLAAKFGSFWFTMKDYKLDNSWMSFPKEKVFTDSPAQFNAYPVDNQTFFGAMPIPANRWVHLAVTYDQNLKVIRTWIDGSIDRTRYLQMEWDAPVLNDPTKPVEFLKGMKNVRLAGIKLSKGVRPLGAKPVMEAYVQQLPYENKVAVLIDHIDKSLPLPIEVAILMEDPAGSVKVPKRITLDSNERATVQIDMPAWKNAIYTVTIKAYSRNQTIFSRAIRVANTGPGKQIRVNSDKSLSVGGKKIFPLFIYHAFPEDYGLLADIGFNIIMPRGLGLKLMGTGGSTPQAMADLKKCLDEAAKQKVYLIVEANTVFGNLSRVPLFKDHPGLLAWSGFDEPWGALERFQESYNMVKLLDPDRPVFGTQNNATRFAETAEGVDIIAPDSYPVPKTSLRDVAFRTAAAAKAVSGLKPVWTILGQYGTSRPNLQELRCMVYLAIISGANGLGFYAWDDRLEKKTGWYTREHPEDEQVLRKVAHEIKALEPILLLPNSVKRAYLSSNNSALHAALKEDGSKRYLLIANDSRQAEEGLLTIEGIHDAVGNCLSGTSVCSTVHIKEGTVYLKLAPLETMVYEIR